MQYLLWNMTDQLYGFFAYLKNKHKICHNIHASKLLWSRLIDLFTNNIQILRAFACEVLTICFPHIAFWVYHQKIWLGIKQASNIASNIALSSSKNGEQIQRLCSMGITIVHQISPLTLSSFTS
jgi:hypothetical protein